MSLRVTPLVLCSYPCFIGKYFYTAFGLFEVERFHNSVKLKKMQSKIPTPNYQFLRQVIPHPSHTILHHTYFLSSIRASYTVAQAQNTVPRITAVAHSLCSNFPDHTLRYSRMFFDERYQETNSLNPVKYNPKMHYQVTNSMELSLS